MSSCESCSGLPLPAVLPWQSLLEPDNRAGGHCWVVTATVAWTCHCSVQFSFVQGVFAVFQVYVAHKELAVTFKTLSKFDISKPSCKWQSTFKGKAQGAPGIDAAHAISGCQYVRLTPAGCCKLWGSAMHEAWSWEWMWKGAGSCISLLHAQGKCSIR